MPRSASPPRGPRSGRDERDGGRGGDRDRGGNDRSDRDRPRDYDRPTSSSRHHDRDRDRSLSPPSRSAPRKKSTKELSFYKKSSSSLGSFSQRRDPLEEETGKERMERRERGEIPARFGGTREQGVRNTMSTVAPVGTANSSMGSFRRGGDPLDRMPVKGGGGEEGGGGGGGGGGADRAQQERLAQMEKPTGPVAGPAPTVRPGRFIEVIANDRMGRKVRVKCLPTDTVGDLKKLIAAQTGTTAQKIQLKKWYTSFKDHVTLRDYEINDGMSLEMY